MTLREVSEQGTVPLPDLLSALNLPADTDPNVLIKDLIVQEKLAEVSVVQQGAAVPQEQ